MIRLAVSSRATPPLLRRGAGADSGPSATCSSAISCSCQSNFRNWLPRVLLATESKVSVSFAVVTKTLSRELVAYGVQGQERDVQGQAGLHRFQVRTENM